LIIDGEVISADLAISAANFSQLQDDLSRSRYDRMAYYAFDLLYLDGYDLRAAALIDRKRALAELLTGIGDIGPIFYSEHFAMSGSALFEPACQQRLEGIVSKVKAAPYRSERNESWIKVKCIQTARYEVIGYKDGATSLYRRDGDDLIYAGKAGYRVHQCNGDRALASEIKPITVAEMHRKNKIDHWAVCRNTGLRSSIETSRRTACCATPRSARSTPARWRRNRWWPSSNRALTGTFRKARVAFLQQCD
jgi:ATP-dependent DNA ligase